MSMCLCLYIHILFVGFTRVLERIGCKHFDIRHVLNALVNTLVLLKYVNLFFLSNQGSCFRIGWNLLLVFVQNKCFVSDLTLQVGRWRKNSTPILLFISVSFFFLSFFFLFLSFKFQNYVLYYVPTDDMVFFKTDIFSSI